MTQEEKAKAYDEALERARIWKDKSGMPADKQGILDDIFPELKESEDEKLRKDLLQIAKESEDSFYMVMTPDKREQLIAWLEKQGEQKPQRMISAEAKEAMYAKTAWSEEDEEMLVDAYVMLDWYRGNNWWTARRIKDWLNSLKERIGG